MLLPFPFKCKPLSKSGEDIRLWSEGGPGEPGAQRGRRKRQRYLEKKMLFTEIEKGKIKTHIVALVSL